MSIITFLIGNGFDLACGLKSRYSDTYDEYVHGETSSETIRAFKNTIESNIESWADFEMKIVEYAKTFSSEDALIECIRDYELFLNYYLEREQRGFWDIISEDNEIRLSVREEMVEGLTKFYMGLTPNDIRTIEPYVKDNKACSFRFISFNYTDLLDVFLNDVVGELFEYRGDYKPMPITHIHGQIGKDIVLGIDNEAQASGLPYALSRKGKRNIIKPTLLVDYDKFRLDESRETVLKSGVICVFGLSLGESDLTWRNTIADWLLASPLNHLVFFVHALSQKKYASIAVTQRIDDEEEAKDHLFEMLFGDQENQKIRDKVYRQIHVPTGRSIFNISEAISRAKKSNKSEVTKTGVAKGAHRTSKTSPSSTRGGNKDKEPLT